MPVLSKEEIDAFKRPFQEKGGDIFLALGVTPLEMDEGRAVMKIPFGPNTSQRTGVFAAGALISLADITATAACYRKDGTFPFSVQLNANLLKNTDHGDATAEARVVHSGRMMTVVETVVRDDKGTVLARVSTTHLNAAPARKKDQTPVE